MGNIIVILVIVVLLSGASFKMYKDKKNNVKCSGCPSCSSKGSCSSYHEND